MNKLNYGNYNASISDIAFSATNGYSDPASELETRKQLSYPLKEVKDFVNNTVAEDSNGDAVQLLVTSDDTLQYRTAPDATPVDISGVPSGGTSGQVVKKNSDNDTVWGDNVVNVLTTAPTGNNTDGTKLVYLTSEPGTKYDGYIYLIKE